MADGCTRTFVQLGRLTTCPVVSSWYPSRPTPHRPVDQLPSILFVEPPDAKGFPLAPAGLHAALRASQ